MYSIRVARHQQDFAAGKAAMAEKKVMQKIAPKLAKDLEVAMEDANEDSHRVSMVCILHDVPQRSFVLHPLLRVH